MFLLRKIALPYSHKCLLGFVEAKHGDQQEYLKFILVREVNPVVSGRRACALLIVGWTVSRDLHLIFGPLLAVKQTCEGRKGGSVLVRIR